MTSRLVRAALLGIALAAASVVGATVAHTAAGATHARTRKTVHAPHPTPTSQRRSRSLRRTPAPARTQRPKPRRTAKARKRAPSRGRRSARPTGTPTPTPAATPVPRTPPPAATPSPRATAVVDAAEIGALGQRLTLPIAGITAAQIFDTFAEARGEHRHEATDIVAPRGALVVAVDDGMIAKLFTSDAGGLTVYQFDPSATWTYYYAHLDRYAEGLHDGMVIRRGDPIGYVGTTGNAGATPHLHFAILKVAPDRQWWGGTPIDPYPLLRAMVERR